MGTRLVTRAFDALGNEPDAAQRLRRGPRSRSCSASKYWTATRRAKLQPGGRAHGRRGVGMGYLMERHRDSTIFSICASSTEIGGGDYDPPATIRGRPLFLVAKANGVPVLRDNSVLRYFELAVGYGTRGYPSPPGVERKRNLYFGVSVNLSEVLAQTFSARQRARPRATWDGPVPGAGPGSRNGGARLAPAAAVGRKPRRSTSGDRAPQRREVQRGGRCSRERKETGRVGPLPGSPGPAAGHAQLTRHPGAIGARILGNSARPRQPGEIRGSCAR